MSRTILAPITSLFAPTDEQAMWRVQMHDDPEAFAMLVRRWEGPIQRLCARMIGDLHRGQDLAQETFSRLFNHRKNYQSKARFSTFLWRVALNLCYDELRKLTRRHETPLDDGLGQYADGPDALAAEDPTPDARLVAEERCEMVRKALLQLPEAFRSVLILRHYENLKFREIADVLEIPEGTVKSRMAEALTQLHRVLMPALREPNSSPVQGQPKRIEESLVL